MYMNKLINLLPMKMGKILKSSKVSTYFIFECIYISNGFQITLYMLVIIVIKVQRFNQNIEESDIQDFRIFWNLRHIDMKDYDKRSVYFLEFVSNLWSPTIYQILTMAIKESNNQVKDTNAHIFLGNS